jgi:hypothetical protein
VLARKEEMAMTQLTDYEDNRERQRAYARCQASSALRPYTSILFGDLLEDEPDWQWVATAPESEIIRWAEERRDMEKEPDGHEEVTSERDEDWQ